MNLFLRRALMLAIVGHYPEWMHIAHKKFNIPYLNLLKAILIDPNIKNSFNGIGRWIVSKGNSWITTNILNTSNNILYYCKWKEPSNLPIWALFGALATNNSRSGILYHSYNRLYIAAGSSDMKIPYNINTIKYGNEEYNELTIEYTGNTINSTINNVLKNDSYVGSININTPIALFACNSSDSVYGKAPEGTAIGIWSIIDNNITKGVFVPINHPNRGATMVNLMYDPTLSIAYPTKEGIFTIE